MTPKEFLAKWTMEGTDDSAPAMAADLFALLEATAEAQREAVAERWAVTQPSLAAVIRTTRLVTEVKS